MLAKSPTKTSAQVTFLLNIKPEQKYKEENAYSHKFQERKKSFQNMTHEDKKFSNSNVMLTALC
jgi:hypothetical protein